MFQPPNETCLLSLKKGSTRVDHPEGDAVSENVVYIGIHRKSLWIV
jgi:hypothetical protein